MLNKKYYALIRTLGIDPRRTLYTFRHTLAANLMKSTHDQILVKSMLGHSSFRTTAQNYIHYDIRDISRKINESFHRIKVKGDEDET